MKIHYDKLNDQAYVDITEDNDLYQTKGRLSLDDYGNVVGIGLEHLSRGVTLRGVPAVHKPEIARRLRKRGIDVR
jgi:uncharacterized protein YuzE